MSESSRSLSLERQLLEAIHAEAVQAVDSGRAVARVLRRRGAELWLADRLVPGRLTVLGLGKAAGPMAVAVEALAGDRIDAGLIVTRDGLSAPLERMTHLRGDHPLPGRASDEAARLSLELIQSMPPENVLLVLLSGGASSLVFGPPRGVTSAEVAELNRLLLESGAAIGEVNGIRRHVSVCGGGKLADAAAAHRIEVLVVSDVPGDQVEVVGSGPFARSAGDAAKARESLRARGLDVRLSAGLLAFLERGRDHSSGHEARSGRRPASVNHHIVASNREALDAALDASRRLLIQPIRLTGDMRGEARRVGRHAGVLGRVMATQSGLREPRCLVMGGETTVTVKGAGVGGRSQELALAAAVEIAGHQGVAMLAAGTDGSDGPTDAAGAFVDGGTVERGLAKGVDALECLSANDSYGYFATEGGLVKTGPTGTNVMDLALVFIGRLSAQR